MKIKSFPAIYGSFLALSTVAMRIGWLIPDGAGYCSYLASLFFDGDLNFWNQYALSGIITPTLIHGATLTQNGYIFTFWGIGAPLLWMPFWLLGHALTLIASALGQPWTPNGFTVYYNFAVRFGTALMGLCALTMNGRWAQKYCSSRTAFLGMLFVAFGTPYYWYLFNFGDCSHVPASFAISLFLITFEAFRKERERKIALLLGLLGGLVSMVKPNHVFIFLFPLAMWIAEWRTASRRNLYTQAAWVGFGALLAFGLQIWVWQILFGNPLGPILEKGVTHYYKFFAGRFWLLDVLFSSYHGLFFFAPLAICSFIGLARLIRIDRVVAIPALIILALQILLMANERYFWEGGSFGLRRVVDWTPLFALGIAYSLESVFRRKWILVPAAATLWTLLLALTYIHHPIGLLNDYQPPGMVLSWIAETLTQWPDVIRSIFSLPAPAQIFLPALIVFGILGYFMYKVIWRLSDTAVDRAAPQNVPLRVLMVYVLVVLCTGYVLVSRAAIRGDESKAMYARQLRWLAQRQESIMALEEVSFLLNEGKYIALSRNWDAARGSFIEALQMSPIPEETAMEISRFAQQHLSVPEAQQYVNQLKSAK